VTKFSKRFIGSRQTTVAREVVLSGIGVHSGSPVSIALHPAEADAGIRFLVTNGSDVAAEIAADVRCVTNTQLCTVLSGENGASVATVEHLMSALRGLSIDNVYVEIDSHEVPIMDGSASAFVDAIDEAGVRELPSPRKFIQVLKTVRVEENGCIGELSPYSGFRLDVEIAFDTDLIGRQRMSLDMSPGVYRAEVSRARTFGFMRDVERLWAAGRALGASLDNTVAIGEDRIINPEGLRYPDEFVRHKMLDAVGDLALAGAPLLGSFRSVRGGHRLNAAVLQALFADEDAWTVAYAPRTSREPAYAAEHSYGLAAANFAADRT
jgi:UDP-3-O-[3-hydroxymyristoyl] N-acetylglucosamine deacetylase